MRNILLALCVCLFLVGKVEASTPETGGEKGEIKRFRFQRHPKQGFERLVLEFTEKENTPGTPSVKVTAQPAEKNVVIAVEKFSLVGAIPEAAMNESFASQSKYLGALSINTDKANSLFIKATVKDTVAVVDAFWLENPNRLVLDAYEPTSPRAAGPAVLTEAPAKPEKRKTSSASLAEGTPRKGRGRNKNFVCFPSNTQVVTTTSYENPEKKEGMRIETDGTPVSTNLDTVACYPRNAKLKAPVKVVGDSDISAYNEKGPKGPEEPLLPKENAVAQAPVSPAAPAAPAAEPARQPSAEQPAAAPAADPEHQAPAPQTQEAP